MRNWFDGGDEPKMKKKNKIKKKWETRGNGTSDGGVCFSELWNYRKCAIDPAKK